MAIGIMCCFYIYWLVVVGVVGAAGLQVYKTERDRWTERERETDLPSLRQACTHHTHIQWWYRAWWELLDCT